jgi:ribosomal protein S21
MRNPSIDLPVIKVDGNLERAIQGLKRRVEAGGYLRTLKARSNNPTRSDRRRFKEHKAATRRRKAEQQELSSAQEGKKRAQAVQSRGSYRELRASV